MDPGGNTRSWRCPRAWEHGDGRVDMLTQERQDVRDAQDKSLSIERYRERFEARLRALPFASLEPGRLSWHTADCTGAGPVKDGDTLCCACSRSEAVAGRCHRVWMAPFLVRAGWRVILDGVEVPDANA